MYTLLNQLQYGNTRENKMSARKLRGTEDAVFARQRASISFWTITPRTDYDEERVNNKYDVCAKRSSIFERYRTLEHKYTASDLLVDGLSNNMRSRVHHARNIYLWRRVQTEHSACVP